MEKTKRQPIRSRLMKIIVMIAASSLALTSLFGILSMLGIQKEAEDALTEQAKDDLEHVIESKTSLANEKLKKYTDIVKEFSLYVEEINGHPDRYKHLDLSSLDTYDTGDLAYSFALADESFSWDKLEDKASLLANVAQRFYPVVSLNGISTTYCGFDDGLLLSFDPDSEKIPPELMYYDFLNTDWYKMGKEADGPAFTEVYPDSFGRGLTISCITPVHAPDGSVSGVLGMDIGITDLYDSILDLDIGIDISAFIVDENGNMISADSQQDNGDGTRMLDLLNSDRERMESFSNGIVVRDNMYYAFSTIESVGWKLCVRAPKSEVLQLADSIGQEIVSSIIIFVIFFLIILVSVVIIVYEFSEDITMPIIKLTKDVAEISSGDLDHEAKVYLNDEIGDLAGSFNEMALSLKDHISTMTRITAEKERVSTELGIAAKMQSDMLPKNFPERSDLEIFATMSPAKEMGGDFYDFFMIDGDHLGLVMADVSGKGIPAAMFMIVAKTLIKIRTTAPGSPSMMLRDINNTLCADNPSELFVTVWFGILTLSTGEIIYSNAGHEYPALMHNNGEYELIEDDNMPPLATVEGLEFIDSTLKLHNGDRLFLYTDGVPEAKNADGQRFGTDKMLNILNRDKNAAPADLLKSMKEEVDAFTGEIDPFDDVTMMSILWKGGN